MKNNLNVAKDKLQRNILNLWWKNNCIGTAEAATAFGKCRLGVLAIAHLNKTIDNFNALIITPTTEIKKEWEREFIKWGEANVFYKCVDVQCINTARKYKKRRYELVIADEIHNYLLGEKNTQFFKNNKYCRILGLSATIDNSLLDTINKIAPIFYTLSLQDAVDLGMVSKFTIYNIPVKLNAKEKKEYDSLTSKIQFAWERYNIHSWKNISARKNILYHAKAKIKLLEKIIKLFDKNAYGIVFSMTKDYANDVKKDIGDRCVIHHSGITKKKRIENLKKFSDNRTKVKILSSAKTLDEGVTLPKLSYAIIMSSSSKPKQMRQRVGRVVRLDINNKHAIIIRLYCKNTKESEWIESSQSKLEIINVKTITKLKKLIKNKYYEKRNRL